MNALFVALGIMVLALLALLLWFVPHLLQQQATRVAGETAQLREMMLDLLNEQEAVMIRQTQLGGSLTNLRDQLEVLAKEGLAISPTSPQAEHDIQRVEDRISQLQEQIQEWAAQRSINANRQVAQDNESWAYLLSLLSTIQDRVGELTQERAAVQVGVQAAAMLEELEQEMHNLRNISEDISKLQWRLRKSLHERESNISSLRTHVNSAS